MVINLATEVMEKILSLGKVCRLFVEVQCYLFMLQIFFLQLLKNTVYFRGLFLRLIQIWFNPLQL